MVELAAFFYVAGRVIGAIVAIVVIVALLKHP